MPLAARGLCTTITVVAILVGGLLAVRSGSERGRLRSEYLELSRYVAELTIDDRAKVAVVAIDTGEPMHFAWRIYLPENYTFYLSNSSGSMRSARPTSRSEEFVARIRFRKTDDGHIEVFDHFYGGLGVCGIGIGEQGVALLGQHWDRLEIKQLGADGIVSFAPNEARRLLQISLPEDVRAEIGLTWTPPDQSHLLPHVYEVTLGRPTGP